MKKSHWVGGLATWTDDDTAFVSVAFSWMLPKALEKCIEYSDEGYIVRAGGPAVWVRPKYLAEIAEIGGEVDALVHHNSSATIASRGCPVGCYFCVVPTMEGKDFELLWDFVPRPILCDNNLSGLPIHYQQYIIKRYEFEDVPLLDANSGFEPRSFDEDCYHRWKGINKGAWRFAFDEIEEEFEAHRTAMILKDEYASKKRVYVLIGNEPIQSCYERIMKVIEWGCEPHVQPMMALNTLEKHPMVKYDWTEKHLRDMARWANRWMWRKLDLRDYKPRKNDAPLFKDIL